jgi:glycosyltransferase involved in cell wall biosynthesis
MSWLPDLRAGGVESSLVLELVELRRRGFEVSAGIIGRDTSILYKYENEGIRVFQLGDGSYVKRGRALLSILRRERPDVVESILFWPNVVVRPLARLLGIRVVTQLANEEYGKVQRAKSQYGPVGVSVAQILDIITSRFADCFRSVSYGVASMMERRLLLPHTKMAVVHVARETQALGSKSEERRARVRSEMEIESDAFVIMSTGRLDAQKNLPCAISAVAQLNGTHSRVVFLIAGRSGNESKEVTEAMSHLPVSVEVRILGERNDVADLLSASDCFIMASRWEGFSGALVEAMALELPLVLSDISSMREVTDGHAWFFGQDDVLACAALLNRVREGLYPEPFISAARERVLRELSLESVGSQLEALYRGLIEASQR